MTPIILHHGLFGLCDFKLGPLKMSYFGGIDQALVTRGHPLVITHVHPTGGIALRAKQLKERICAECNGEPVVIIAHSMGGLDARYMITHLGMAERVAALITVSTPHRGSPYADWCVKHLGKRLGGLRLMKSLNVDVDAFSDLTTECCARFNEQTPDAPAVRYFSVSAARPWNKVPPWALHSWRVIHAAEGPNDGLVSVTSAQWAHHVETWPADHWHTINKRFVIDKNGTGDIVPYYLRMLDKVLAA